MKHACKGVAYLKSPWLCEFTHKMSVNTQKSKDLQTQESRILV